MQQLWSRAGAAPERRRIAAGWLVVLLVGLALGGSAFDLWQGRQARAADAAAPDPVAKIKDEGTNHSQVMETLEYLTDVIGPRLTGSPNLHRANEWTRDRLTSWGLENAHLEPWGPFGRGWS